MRKVSIVLKGWIWAAIFVIFVVLIMRFIIINLSGEGLFGFKLVQVSGPSMQSVLPDESYVLCKKLTVDDEIKVGDIYGYELPNGTIIMHRVIDSMDGAYIFKGDDNVYVDSQAVPESAILYKYLFIVYG